MDLSSGYGNWIVRLIVVLGAIIASPSAHADHQVFVIASNPSKVYLDVAQNLEKSFSKLCRDKANEHCHQIKIINVGQKIQVKEVLERKDSRLIVTLGKAAAESVLQQGTKTPTIFSLIPRQLYESKISRLSQHNYTAIYLDQPIERQFELAKTIKVRPHLGIMLSEKNRHREELIRKTAEKHQIQTSFSFIREEDEIGPKLNQLIRECNLLLAIPDPAIYNKNTIFNILLSSYHNQIPMIGFSSSYVKAGALAAVYSTPEEIGRHLGEVVFSYHMLDKQLPSPEGPKYFSVSVNRNVAESLGIALPTDEDMVEIISGSEQ